MHNVLPSSIPKPGITAARPEDEPPHHGVSVSVVVSASRDAPSSEGHLLSSPSLGATTSRNARAAESTYGLSSTPSPLFRHPKGLIF